MPLDGFWTQMQQQLLTLTLHDPMDCNPPGFSVHGIFHARMLAWVVISFFKVLPDPELEPLSPVFPAMQVNSLPLSHWGNPFN